MTAPRWACGMTTVPRRIEEGLTERTLKSLANGGFEVQRLFVDGKADVSRFACEVTVREPALRTYGNWVLSAAELLIRNPGADRFAVFQDDFVISRNVRQYLDRLEYPKRGYWNLYTFPSNQAIALVGSAGRVVEGWYEARELDSGPLYHGRKGQTGRGAVALIFDREALVELFGQRHMAERPLDVKFGWRKVDGAIVCAMNKAGRRELVHNPSLVQHVGKRSTMGNMPHKSATSFHGEGWDALSLIS